MSESLAQAAPEAVAVTAQVAVTVVPPVPVDAPAVAAASEPVQPLRAAVVRNAWKDLRRFSAIFFMLTTLLSSYHAFRLKFGDVHDFYAYVGAEAPLTVERNAAGEFVRGHAETVFRPGERVGWVSNFCANAGAAYTAHVALVRLERGGKERTTVASRSATFAGDAARCGPLFGSLALTAEAAPGEYEIERWGVFRDGSWWPLPFYFPGVRFTVVAPPPSP